MSEGITSGKPNSKALNLLGTPLLLTEYSALVTFCEALSRDSMLSAVEFCNTQIVTMRRHDPGFRGTTDGIDFFIPDGMPLVWCLNLKGAGLKDRVYGPTFMLRFMEQSRGTSTHYLLGGSEECGRRLRSRFEKLNPDARFVGAYHGRCDENGVLEGAAESAVVEELNRLSPDFIWVGLGTPKQQAWIRRNKNRIRRGVLLSVGFAFDVNAGMKPDAPAWMQRLGLTWLFRMASEPTRLIPRYIRYNSLFLWYLAWDGLRGRVFRTTFNPQKPEVV